MTTLERVLSCTTLPTLPGVAVEVLKLTRRSDVSLGAISAVIENDPGLASKILKTVNSSFYGLQQPCSRLDRAASYLGLQAVKALVLGFSLVEAGTGVRNASSFDLRAYWRRTIFAAAAARRLAQATRQVDVDEAFTAALFQDIGILACVAALGDEYVATLATAPDDHDLLCGHEREVFPFDHTTVGAELARRWKLPDIYAESIRRHHSPETPDLKHAPMVRLTALAMDLAQGLSAPGRQAVVARLARRADAWVALPADRMAQILRQTAASAAELAKIFDQDVSVPDAARIMAEAQECLVASHLEAHRENDRLRAESQADPLTGTGNRRRFDEALAVAFAHAKAERRSLSLLFIDADHFKAVNDTHGHAAGDAVLKEIAARVVSAIDDAGEVCRYGGEEFAAILPGHDGVRARELADALRRVIAERSFELPGTLEPVTITVSVGIATMEAGSGAAFDAPAALLAAADHAAYAAKNAGRNCIRTAAAGGLVAVAPACYVPSSVREAEARGPGRSLYAAADPLRSPDGVLRVLIVEDDPLAGRLLSMLFQRITMSDVRWVPNAASAGTLMEQTPGFVPGLAVIDLNLPDARGTDVARAVRAAAPCIRRVAIVTASSSTLSEAERLDAGIDVFLAKHEVGADLGGWLNRLLAPRDKVA